MSARIAGPLVAGVIGVVGGVYIFKPFLEEDRKKRAMKAHQAPIGSDTTSTIKEQHTSAAPVAPITEDLAGKAKTT